jgi:Uma2 family endonuclease
VTIAYPRHEFSFADYLVFERNSEGKHEYFDGEIYAMGGGTVGHAILGAAVSAQLSRQLEGKPCRVYSSDLRVRALATGLATYADVTVICGLPELDPEDNEETVINPTVVVEVTSPTSEKRDRGKKLEHYKLIPSLRAVVIVSHRERLIEVHWLASEGWAVTSATEGAIGVPGIDATLDVGALYAAAEELR